MLLLTSLVIGSPGSSQASQASDCPFPSSQSSDEDEDETSLFDNDSDDDWAPAPTLATAEDISWFGLSLSLGYGRASFADQIFSGGTDARASGADLVGDLQLVGASLAVELYPVEPLRFELGFGGYGGFAGRETSVLATGGSVIGATPGAPAIFSIFGEVGIAPTIMGPVRLVSALHVEGQVAMVNVSVDCECEGEMMATRALIGPRLGLRTQVGDWVFVEGTVLIDATALPGYLANLGVGVAPASW